ncbi:ABC transporter substrate-binding protein [Halomarina pelagica]|uniref:ABC transporter substrate-binding protein n=1 Tax=Halomarina pelagica TaxID=2961599 RepID=UPI0020C360BD
MGLAGCSSDGGGNESDDGGNDADQDLQSAGGLMSSEAKLLEQPPDPIPEGGTFTVGLTTQPKGLNTLATSSSYSFAILDFVNEFGTALVPETYEVKPSVYTKWTAKNTTGKNAKPDVFFNVREGLTWSDGKKLTVDDVVFTYNFMMEQKPGRYISTVRPIESVEKASGSEWDVHMKLERPIGTYQINQLQLPILPKHVWSNVGDYQTYSPTKHGGPIGLGPGKVTTYNPSTAVEITFRDDYELSSLPWIEQNDFLIAGGPFLDSLRFKVYGSQSARRQAFFRGEIDAMYLGLQKKTQSTVKKVEKNERLTMVTGPDSGYSHHSYNLRRTPLDDATFRQVLGFAFDDYYWITNLQRGYAIEGDFVMPPGYAKVRPESGSDASLLKADATQAFSYRSKGEQSAEPDIEGMRTFLKEGKVIDGTAGTYAGVEYPGSITGVEASQTEAKHDYTFGPVESSVLQNADTDEELRVNGKTITQHLGRPMKMYIDPPKESPQEAEMFKRYVRVLKRIGIPVQTQVLEFNTQLTKVYGKEDFDIFTMGWNSLSPLGVSSLYNLMHSDNADDHSKTDTGKKKNTSTLLNNPMGYGLPDNAGADDLISQARTTMDDEKRNELVRKAVEKLYLDFPTMVTDYDNILFPVDGKKYGGFITGITDPGAYNFAQEMKQVYRKQG